MGFSTFSGPIRSGTVRYTTGTTAGYVDNTGLPVLAQSTATGDLAVATPATVTSTIGWIPAGSQIIEVQLDTTTGFTFTAGTTPAATVTVGDGTTANKFVTTATVTSEGRVLGSATGTLSNWTNIGTTDIPIVVTIAYTGSPTAVTAGAMNLTVRYVQKSSSGSEVPTNP